MSSTDSQVIVTSEWMTHYVGEPLQQADVLWLLDSPNGPILFYADPGPKGEFMMLKNDGRGGRHTINLSLMAGAGNGMQNINAIAAYQDANGLIYVAVAGQLSWLPGKTRTHVECFEKLDYTKLEDGKHWAARSTGFYTGLGVRDKAVPWLGESNVKLSYGPGPNGPRLLCLQKSKANKYTDKLPDNYVALVEFKFDEKRHYAGYTKINFPDNDLRQDTFKFAVATLPPDNQRTTIGMYVYYPGGGQGKSYLDFTQVTGDQVAAELQFEGDLQSLNTIAAPGQATDAVVGSTKGLFHFLGSDYNGVRYWGRSLASGSFTHVRGVLNSDGTKQVWGVQDGGRLGFTKVDAQGLIVQEFTVVQRGDFHRVSPSHSRDGELQRILFSDTQSNVTLLERSPIGLWTKSSLNLNLGEKVIEQSCYVTHVRFQTDKPSESAGRALTVSCTSAATVLINDDIYTIDSQGVSVLTDSSGKLQIVQLNSTLASPHIDVKDASLTIDRIDPAAKVKAKFGQNLTPAYLRDLKNAAGTSIFPSSTDFDKLSNVFGELKNQMGGVPGDGSERPAPNGSHSWDLFHEASQAISKFEELYFEAGRLIVSIAGEIKRFSLQCYEHILKALETVGQVVGASMKDLQHWLGWVFNWDDILSTQKSLIALAEVASSAGDDLLDYGFETLDHALVAAKQKFQSYTAPTRNTQVQNTPKDIKAPQASASSKDTPSSHSGIDYILEKLKAIFHSPAVAEGFTVAGVDINFWTDTVTNIINNIKDDLNALKNDFGDIFAAGSIMTLGHAFEKLGKDLLVTLIDTLRSVLTAFKALIKPVIHSFFAAINTKVNIPILTPLYKFVTKTNDNPSILSLVMLFIAVPTTILGKLAGGENTSFPQYDAQKLRTALYHNATPAPPHNVVAMFNNTSGFKASLWRFYTGPLWTEVLAGYDRNQAFLIAGSFGIQNVLQTLDSAEPANKPLRFDSLGENIFFESFYSCLKLMTQIAYIPVITSPDNVIALEERFLLWGSDWLSTLLDIYSGFTGRTMGAVTNPSKVAQREKVLEANGLLQTAFGILAFVYVEVIMDAELHDLEIQLARIAPADTKAIKAANDSIFRSKWGMVEAFAFLTNRVGNIWVPEIKDVKVRVACAAGIGVVGDIGLVSSVKRFVDTPDSSNYTPPT